MFYKRVAQNVTVVLITVSHKVLLDFGQTWLFSLEEEKCLLFRLLSSLHMEKTEAWLHVQHEYFPVGNVCIFFRAAVSSLGDLSKSQDSVLYFQNLF